MSKYWKMWVAGLLGLFASVASATPTAIEAVETQVTGIANDIASSQPDVIAASLVIFGIIMAVMILKRTAKVGAR